MIITNFNNQYIKLQSSFIQELLENPSDYTSIKVTANINCCTNSCSETAITESLTVDADNKWYVKLDIPVSLDSILRKINFQNLLTNNTFNALGTPVDLSYVSSNCTESSCTMEDFDTYFKNLIKLALDNWFTANSITSDVTVEVENNTVILSDLPANYIPISAEYGQDEPYTEIKFTYGAEDSNIFISGGFIFLSPGFFSLTDLMDGIYKITVKLTKTDDAGYIQEENCAFIDITVKCKVAATLKDILKEAAEQGSEQCSIMLHLLHYALVNGSNCGCNCEELCKVYRELAALITSYNPTLTTDCGC